MVKNLDLKAVESFLNIIKKIGRKKFYIVLNRQVKIKNKIMTQKEALLDLGITNIEEVKDFIYTLEAKDCIDISLDYDSKRDLNTEIFEFRKRFNEILVYIKLTIRNELIVCISFHRNN